MQVHAPDEKALRHASSSTESEIEHHKSRRRHRKKRGYQLKACSRASFLPHMELPGSSMPLNWPNPIEGGNLLPHCAQQGFPGASTHAQPLPSDHLAHPLCALAPPQSHMHLHSLHSCPAQPFQLPMSHARGAASHYAHHPCAPIQHWTQAAPVPEPLLAPTWPQSSGAPYAHIPCNAVPAPPSDSNAPFTQVQPNPLLPSTSSTTHSFPAPIHATHANPSPYPSYPQTSSSARLPSAAASQPLLSADPAPMSQALPPNYPQAAHQPDTQPSCEVQPLPWQPPRYHVHQQQPEMYSAQQPIAAGPGGHQLAVLQGELRVRRAQLVQQLAWLSSQSAEVQAAAASQAHKANTLLQELQERVQSAEAFQLAALNAEKARLSKEVGDLDALLEHMAATLAPTSGSGLLLQAPSLVEEAMRIAAKPLEEQPPLTPLVDVVRSYAQLSEAHSALEQLLQVKDHMISHLLQERDKLKSQLKEQAMESAQVMKKHCARLSSELGDAQQGVAPPQTAAAGNALRHPHRASDRSAIVHDLIAELAEKSKQLLGRAPIESQL